MAIQRVRLLIVVSLVLCFLLVSAKKKKKKKAIPSASVSHILLDDLKTAKLIQQKLVTAAAENLNSQKDPASVAKKWLYLAKTYSKCDASRPAGGSLGHDIKPWQLESPAIANAVFTGDTHRNFKGPIRTKHGYHIIWVLKRKNHENYVLRQEKTKIVDGEEVVMNDSEADNWADYNDNEDEWETYFQDEDGNEVKGKTEQKKGKKKKKSKKTKTEL